MILVIDTLPDDEKYFYLHTISDKSLLDLYRHLIEAEKYEYCQFVLDEIKDRKL